MRRTLMILLLLVGCTKYIDRPTEPVVDCPCKGAPCPVVECPCPAPSPTPTPEPTPRPTPPPECKPGERPGDECAWVQVECRWVCIPPPTPPPPPPPSGGICHVSNKGTGGNHNLVLSWKPGEDHASHLDAGKFCPPDHRGSCSCDQAKADAIACGVPVTGGFTCKVQP